MKTFQFWLALIFSGWIGSNTQALIVEPDDFADNQDISNAVPEVSLSTFPNDGLLQADGSVLAVANANASTGGLVFGWKQGAINKTDFGEGIPTVIFRADFTKGQRVVSIDVINNTDFSFTTISDGGRLDAFDSNGDIIDSQSVTDLEAGQFAALVVKSRASNIYRVQFTGGINIDGANLDNLRTGADVVSGSAARSMFGSEVENVSFAVPTSQIFSINYGSLGSSGGGVPYRLRGDADVIPEPSSLVLLGVGSLLITGRRSKHYAL